MEVNEALLNIRAILNANEENCRDAYDEVLLCLAKIKESKKQLEELQLNAYKKYKNDEIPIEDYNKIISSITLLNKESDGTHNNGSSSG